VRLLTARTAAEPGLTRLVMSKRPLDEGALDGSGLGAVDPDFQR